MEGFVSEHKQQWGADEWELNATWLCSAFVHVLKDLVSWKFILEARLEKDALTHDA